MDGTSILLAHKNPIVLTNLADELKRRRVRAEVRMAWDEVGILHMQWFHPSRVVLLDLAFAQSERLLQCMSADPTCPCVYVCSDSTDEGALPEAVRQGACRYAVGKTPVGVICDHLENMLMGGTPGQTPASRCDRRESARRLLLLAGVSPRTKGGRCIRMALEMAGGDRGLLNNLNGRLFPAMALQVNDAPNNIERCMRYAVDQIWRGMPPEDWLRLMPGGGRPTVKQFLGALLDRLDGQDEMSRGIFG